MFIPFFLMVLFVMISIAFFTLMEVRFLGVIHQRMGPMKVGIIGIFQPFGDFVSLFGKMMWFPKKMESVLFFFSPLFSIFVGVVVWAFFGTYYPVNSVSWSVLSFFLLSGILVYFLLMMGWSSGSYYSLLGSFRSVSQAISYDVVLFFILLPFLSFFFCFKMGEIFLFSFFSCFLSFPFFLIWLFSCLAESNRSPFDFSEGESELVSGFNTEILGGFFTFIFITEYGFMMFLGFMTVLFFLGFSFFWLSHLIVISFFLLVRGVYPRMRFDVLMMMVWKKFLLFVIFVMVFLFSYGY
uniref:NADH-ubiquinone oxidoreductase chain 1 n=1 Tax=Walchia hayashii TaxID=436352 RepID=B3IUL4_9ACAR|nr:NADH dehydrogenase subunit 1 [Walchia hayashii]BAG24168.1 NADH dehydrogenase subunit 1 [Walchia hayashii]